MGSSNLFLNFSYLWVKRCNLCNLSSRMTSCLIWRYKHQRVFPFSQQWCTPSWKIRISDTSDLTCKTFCLAEGKYLGVLKPILFQMLKWIMMAALISFKCVTEHAVQRPCTPSCAQPRPWSIKDTCMGVVLGGCWVGVVLISTVAKTVTPENQVCN